MGMGRKKYTALLVFGVIVLIIVILDYLNGQIIPNIIFLDNFTVNDVTSYWKGVIGSLTLYVSLVTFQQTADKFLFEKEYHNEMKKRDTIRRYQDLLKTAIEILNDKFDNENECLFAVQIIKNIIDLSIDSTSSKKMKEQMEPVQIISIEGALGILKGHFDRVLVVKDDDRKRQDIQFIVNILFGDNFSNKYKHIRNNCGIYAFENLFINVDYFENIKLKNTKFERVKFYGNEKVLDLTFEDSNIFIDCTFDCEFKLNMRKYASVILNKCRLKEIRVMPIISKSYIVPKEYGTKNLEMNDCIVTRVANLTYNSFSSLKICNCKFEQMLFIDFIRVESEFTVSETELNGGINFTGSIIQWKMDFSNTVCRRICCFWDSKLYKQEKICFDNFLVEDFDRDNMSVEVYWDPNRKEYMHYFGDIYEVIRDKKSELYTLKRK